MLVFVFVFSLVMWAKKVFHPCYILPRNKLPHRLQQGYKRITYLSYCGRTRISNSDLWLENLPRAQRHAQPPACVSLSVRFNLPYSFDLGKILSKTLPFELEKTTGQSDSLCQFLNLEFCSHFAQQQNLRQILHIPHLLAEPEQKILIQS